MTVAAPTFDLVVAANRLPVDHVVDANGEGTWRRSPGGLVTAMESVMRGRDAAWVGWAGEPGPAPEPFLEDGRHLHPVGLSPTEIQEYYEGFSNDTLWPIYHDVIVPATFHRNWWNTYRTVNHRFAQAIAEVAAPGATVWVHDYQLQLVPAMVRAIRPDVRIGWFNHIPFPPVELFSQLPWRRALVEGLLGADFLGFQRTADARNFLRCCRALLGMTTKSDTVTFVPPGDDPSTRRTVRACAIPISVDYRGLDQLSRTPEVVARAAEIRASLGDPKILMLGVDRLDYTKGIRHRLKAYEELLADKAISPPDVTLLQVATPSRERVDAYRHLREEIERTVGRINGEYSDIGSPAVNYLYQTYPRTEMTAMFLAADVALVTPLRDGMNLIAKEYVACRHDLGGALVLSEFAGAWHELHQAYICNPHDIEGVKQTIMRAITAPDDERRRRMKALRKRVADHDVQRWASRYLQALASAPAKPHWSSGTSDEERQGVEQANRANQRASDKASERVTGAGKELRIAVTAFAARPRVLIAVDFDGTLAPFVIDPLQARAVPGGLEALRAAAALDGVTTAIVSGRDLTTLAALTGIGPDDGVTLIGSHGAQANLGDAANLGDRRNLNPAGDAASLDDDATALLSVVRDELEAIRSRYPAVRLEHKPSAVVLHTRGVEPSVATAATTAAREVGERFPGVHVMPGKGVVELTVLEANKGTALVELARATGSDATLYLGDDVTDERAFAALNPASGDLTVKVGDGETAAAQRVRGPEDVVELLELFVDQRRIDQGHVPG